MLKKTGIIFFCLGINLAYSDNKANTPNPTTEEESNALQGKAAKEKPAEKKINASPPEPKMTKTEIHIIKNIAEENSEKITEKKTEKEKEKKIVINPKHEAISAPQSNQGNVKNKIDAANFDQQSKDNSQTNIPKYADKNLSNALEQLRDEKDQLQTEFEKLLEKQAATNELISQNEALKLEIIELKKNRDDTKVIIGNELKNQQLLEKLNQSLEKIDILTTKMQNLDKEKFNYKATDKALKNTFYTIKENDTLPKIANRECKNIINWRQIYTENSKTLKDENSLTVGLHIKLPENCIPR